ncbi:hypothetical protein PQO03_13505 [Lentisphaera profundi]|uniref:Uncharacterized protein n=1 Tax=Lentisphaera profundi TaxID=1658616 RepID=A0ABY7VY53_9BACT|nr:hypothetical protein [Lentisphaera profundi]WDE98851.1 hypothetical protein PQO03_13505 [Lentisphaera profundi]
MKKLISALILIACTWQIFTNPSIANFFKADSTSPKKEPHPGIVKVMPQQLKVSASSHHKVDDYTVNELHSFRIRARILSKKNYATGRETDLSTTDLALGWGKMSDLKVLEKITISQSGRWYFWNTSNFPIPRREIETLSANMHLIPATPAVQTQIDATQKGDIIEITGSLVKVSSNKDNWTWKSSETRNDTGNGACEVIWVKELKIAGKPTQEVR